MQSYVPFLGLIDQWLKVEPSNLREIQPYLRDGHPTHLRTKLEVEWMWPSRQADRLELSRSH